MRYLFLIVLAIFIQQLPLDGQISSPQQWPMHSSCILEHATDAKTIAWGLMGRKSLAPNTGMLFHYKRSQKLSFWMFNCWIDLDLAYLDSDGVVKEIHHLKASPERMDPKRPVNSLADFKQYGLFDPSIRYFQRHSAHSKQAVRYAWEMAAGWFEANQVRIGDILIIPKHAQGTTECLILHRSS